MYNTSMKDFKNIIVYQVWPRSFLDTNGDGIGDIPGIIRKLDHIRSLGTDIIWLSPVYRSGNRDYGYDIDDYYDINPEFGTLEDFDRLVDEARLRDIGIMMDLVANHTSDQHAWFRKALESPDSEYRNYYIFRKGRNGKSGNTAPPNNWMSAFGGSAWQYHANSDEWYLCTFTPNQCDLNWDNPAVRDGIYSIMEFWLKKGIAGFRMDVINTICKTTGLPDAGNNPRKLSFPFEHIVSLPQSHEYISEMHRKVLSRYPDCITVGEGMVTDLHNMSLYTSEDRQELDMMFHFDVHLLGCGKLGKFDFRKFYRWTVRDLKNAVFKWELGIQQQGGWIGNYLSNHDQPRHVSRFGDDSSCRKASARALALLNFTLRGTPFIYQGEEIGMTNPPLERKDWRDFEAFNAYRVLQSMMHLPAFIAERIVNRMSRDNARTPVQWTAEENAGFSSGEPWTAVNPNYREINVEKDLKSEDSLIAFYREIASLRKTRRELSTGTIQPVVENHSRVIGYIREYESERSLILINLTGRKAVISLNGVKGVDSAEGSLPLLSSGPQDRLFSAGMQLEPWEGLIYEL